MATPYEFGQLVGQDLEKQARGFVTDLALYSNPFTGVPTGMYDTYHNLRNGKYLSALGSAASGTMSLFGLGGYGGVAKGLGGGLMRAGSRVGANTMAGTGLHAAGRAIGQGGKALVAAGKPFAAVGNRVVQPIANAAQKVMPVRPAPSAWYKNPGRAFGNYVAKNPVAALSADGIPGGFLHNSTHAPRPPIAPVR